MAKSKRTKKQAKRLTPNQLKGLGMGFSVIDKIKVAQVLNRRSFLKGEISHTYEMSKQFISNHVKQYVDRRIIEEKDLIDRFPEAKTIPYHITIGAYEYQDLAIALILCHVDKTEAWSFDAVIHLEQEDEEQVTTATVNFRRVIPGMTHIEFLRGKKDCKIDLGHGLKTVGWDGFENEVLKELKSHKQLSTDFSIEKIEVVLNADIKFINTAAYEEFLRVQAWVKSGHDVAEKELRELWIREQIAGSTAKTYGYGDVA